MPLIEKNGFYNDIVDDVKKWFYTLNDDKITRKRLLPVEKNWNIISLIKDKTRDRMNTKFVTAIRKTYGYLMQKDNHEIEDSVYIKIKVVKTSASKELTFYDLINRFTI